MKILVVDDMVESRNFLEDLIKYMGYDVAAAENGRQALDLLMKESFDLVISDILMPVMDGYQLCKAIKSDTNLNRIPVMFLTATYTEEQDQELAERMGAGMFVRKPIEAPRLIGLVDQMLGSDAGAGTAVTPEPTETDGEMEILDLYSQRLIRQLEKKMVELEAEMQEKKEKENDLIRSRQKLRDLSAHLQLVREQERMNLAREIHDELGQALTALRMEALLIGSKAESALVSDRVRHMIDFIDSTAGKVQNICSELRPSILDDLGLAAGTEWLVDEFRKHSENTSIKYVYEGEEKVLSQDVSTAAFRILQEALTNVMRHSEAQNVTVALRLDDESLILDVSDDGRGIAPKEMDKTGSFGLLGMRERAFNIQGSLEITGREGTGTSIRLTIPLKGRVDDYHGSDSR